MTNHIEALRGLVEKVTADLMESDEIREKLGHLLTRTAAALKGEPPEGVLHSWHDLPERAALAVRLADDAAESVICTEGHRTDGRQWVLYPEQIAADPYLGDAIAHLEWRGLAEVERSDDAIRLRLLAKDYAEARAIESASVAPPAPQRPAGVDDAMVERIAALGYSDADRARIISSLQSARDRMMAVLPKAYGEGWDGDLDAMLEAINYMKRCRPHQLAAVGEEIMVNAAHDVYILPLQPSGLSSGPRFVVHVPAPEQQPAAPSGAVNVVGMPEFDSLLDHIYEYGTTAEGVVERANAFARAVLARYAPQQPEARVGGEFRDSVLNSARFRASCYALVGIVEGIEGLGRRWAANGERLKDTREWVAFYNAVAAMRNGTTPPPSTVPEGIPGELVEMGDDEEGCPRLVIATTREAIKSFGPNLLFKRVVVAAAPEPGEG